MTIMTNNAAMTLLRGALRDGDLKTMTDVSVKLHVAEGQGAKFSKFVDQTWATLTARCLEIQDKTFRKG